MMSHAHDHASHHRNERRMFAAAALTGGFMLVEVVGGYISGSLALIADAAHMLTDFAALALAWLAFRFSRWPADRERTYGFDRLQVLVAFVSGLSLFLIAAMIVVEAGGRL
jgi:cobalt-zinc-cadmium efflux system protein